MAASWLLDGDSAFKQWAKKHGGASTDGSQCAQHPSEEEAIECNSVIETVQTQLRTNAKKWLQGSSGRKKADIWAFFQFHSSNSLDEDPHTHRRTCPSLSHLQLSNAMEKKEWYLFAN